MASQLDDYAKNVPTTLIDEEVLQYIQREIDKSITKVKSHYTLALYERKETGASWYILDGYYELESGEILFLDFDYDPIRKRWWPISNYRSFTPKQINRYMLQAEEICNPYKRHFIGVVTLPVPSSFDEFSKYLKSRFPYEPFYWIYSGYMYILDHVVTNGLPQSNPLFTLNEKQLIDDLFKMGIYASLMESGRIPSSDELKQTYVPVTKLCKK